MRRVAIALVTLTALATVASAQAVKLGRAQAKHVIVWMSDDAYHEAMELIRAGVHETNPGLLYKYVACYVPAGIPVVVVDRGWLSSTIIITEGDDEGCKGIVPNEELPKQ